MKQRGFTLIELIVIVAVVGILATIAVIGYTRVQADGRDSQRATSVVAIAEGLERYYDENGEYPSCRTMTGTSSTVGQLLGIESASFRAPQSTLDNSFICTAIDTESSTSDTYAYIGDGSTACDTGSSCLLYRLQYREEVSGEIVELASRRTAALSTSGAITLALGEVTSDSIGLSWNALTNATGYVVQRATNATFTANVVDTEVGETTAVQDGLAAATIYYFRVKAVGGTGDGGWSNTVLDRTLLMPPTNLEVTVDSNTAITARWSAAQGATSYTIDMSTSDTFATYTRVSGVTATSRQFTGLDQATTYHFRVRANVGTDSSAFSNPDSGTTGIARPAAPTLSAVGATEITAAWTAISGIDTYTLQYSTSSSFTSTTTQTITGITTTSRKVTGLSQGTPYYFRVNAVSNGVSGASSSSATATTTINAPSAPSVKYTSYDRNAYTMRFDWTAATCPTGTSARFQWKWNRDGDNWSTAWSSATTAVTLSRTAVYEGYNSRLEVQQRCIKGSVNSGWSGSGVAQQIVSVSNATSLNWRWTSTPNTASGTFIWSAVCKSGAIAHFDYNFHVQNAVWPGGYSGWYGGDYPWSNNTSVSMYISNNTHGWNDDLYQLKFRAYCKNTSTNRSSPSRTSPVLSSLQRFAQ
jgi:prepilin-type N-terminal cleavage/methylation domain-containing protein